MVYFNCIFVHIYGKYHINYSTKRIDKKYFVCYTMKDCCKIAGNFLNEVKYMSNIRITTTNIDTPYKEIGPVSVHFTKSRDGAFSSGTKLFENGFLAYIQEIIDEKNELGESTEWETGYAKLYADDKLDEYDQFFVAAVCELRRVAAAFGADAVVGVTKNISRQVSYFKWDENNSPMLEDRNEDTSVYHIEVMGTAVKYLSLEELVEKEIIEEGMITDKIMIRDKVFSDMQDRKRAKEQQLKAVEEKKELEREKNEWLESLELTPVERRIYEFLSDKTEAVPYRNIQDSLNDIPSMDLIIQLKNMVGKEILELEGENNYILK